MVKETTTRRIPLQRRAVKKNIAQGIKDLGNYLTQEGENSLITNWREEQKWKYNFDDVCCHHRKLLKPDGKLMEIPRQCGRNTLQDHKPKTQYQLHNYRQNHQQSTPQTTIFLKTEMVLV